MRCSSRQNLSDFNFRALSLLPNRRFGARLSQAVCNAPSRMSGTTFARRTLCRSLSPPSTGNGRKNLRFVLDHSCLLLRGEQQHAVAFSLECECREDFSTHTEIGLPKM